jgi:hypothetical protein
MSGQPRGAAIGRGRGRGRGRARGRGRGRGRGGGGGPHSPQSAESDNETLRRVREYCELSAMYDANTGVLYDDNDPRPGPRATKPFSEWNVRNAQEWEAEMRRQTLWLLGNKAAVLRVLPQVEPDWPHSATSLRTLLAMVH